MKLSLFVASVFLLLHCARKDLRLSDIQGGKTVPKGPPCYLSAIPHPSLPFLSAASTSHLLHNYPQGLMVSGTDFAIDFSLGIGTPVVAPVDGTVRLIFNYDNLHAEIKKSRDSALLSKLENEKKLSGPEERFINYGYYIVLAWEKQVEITEKDNDDESEKTVNKTITVESLFLHLDKIIVVAGQKVKEGTVLGTSGDTGFITGPHLHYQVQESLSNGSYWQDSLPIRLLDYKEEQMWGKSSENCLTKNNAPSYDLPPNATAEEVTQAKSAMTVSTAVTHVAKVVSTHPGTSSAPAARDQQIEEMKCSNNRKLDVTSLSQNALTDLRKRRELSCFDKLMGALCDAPAEGERPCEAGCVGWVMGNLLKKEAGLEFHPKFNDQPSCLKP